jgi:hypothetical protein
MYQFTLFLHLLVLVASFFTMGLIVNSLIRLRTTRRVSEALEAIAFAGNAEKAMPLVTVALLGTGGYMTQSRWSWTAPWVDVSIIGLLLVTVIGGVVIGRRERALHLALEKTTTESIDGDLARRLNDPFLLVASAANIGLVCGVMFTMSIKPSPAGGIVALLLGGAIGIVAGLTTSRPAASLQHAERRV